MSISIAHPLNFATFQTIFPTAHERALFPKVSDFKHVHNFVVFVPMKRVLL
jgi:hypothetical protein